MLKCNRISPQQGYTGICFEVHGKQCKAVPFLPQFVNILKNPAGFPSVFLLAALWLYVFQLSSSLLPVLDSVCHASKKGILHCHGYPSNSQDGRESNCHLFPWKRLFSFQRCSFDMMRFPHNEYTETRKECSFQGLYN